MYMEYRGQVDIGTRDQLAIAKTKGITNRIKLAMYRITAIGPILLYIRSIQTHKPAVKRAVVVGYSPGHTLAVPVLATLILP